MVTFSNVEAALDQLNQKTPALLASSLLIGGWCALIYYRALAKAENPDFPAPVPENAERLQSNDLDFTNVWSGDFFDALPDFVFIHPKAPHIWKSKESALALPKLPKHLIRKKPLKNRENLGPKREPNSPSLIRFDCIAENWH